MSATGDEALGRCIGVCEYLDFETTGEDVAKARRMLGELEVAA